MSEFWSAWNGFVIMVLMIIIAMALSYFGGGFMDQMQDRFEAQGLYDVPAEWADYSNVYFIRNIFDALCYAIGLLGVAIFFITILFRETYEDRIRG